VFLPQPVGVVGSRLAIGQFCPGQGLDLIQRPEVLKRLLSPFGVLAPGVFAVMAPLETVNSRVRTGVKVA
jgi:hypothetical protein